MLLLSFSLQYDECNVCTPIHQRECLKIHIAIVSLRNYHHRHRVLERNLRFILCISMSTFVVHSQPSPRIYMYYTLFTLPLGIILYEVYALRALVRAIIQIYFFLVEGYRD